ncbi:FAD-dependent oxidoreductase [Saccharopolyspora aridisoli]|uniref:FAD-dependent oxidoreductase n=1 Tax=Saccharopolyspora aridisoli TaxID=2530385 RepID=A0A4R4UUJ9_9PSEU|nr:FAD-dependent oxidoreductase [Saccharopolyspora aridisoli]
MVDFDVVVVGGGNAGFSAAHSAAERGARVLLLEKAAEAEAGGNSYYTAGAFRFTFDDIDDVADLLEPDERHADSVVPAYPASAFHADMDRVTGGRCDPVLTEVLISRSTDTVRWLAGKGLAWRLMYERQAYLSGGKWVFSGGLSVGTVDGGKGLIAQHTAAARQAGVEIRYGAEVTALHLDDRGVTYRAGGAEHRVPAGAIVLAAGGFEASAERRSRNLGSEWAGAYVRGTPTNTGDVLDLALAAGAAPHGDWTTCHSTAWDADADPDGGNRELTNQLTRQSYPLGMVVNRAGERFVDEGADFRNYTYAKYGREVLRQPGGRAFQLFDAKTRPLLRAEEYDSHPIAAAQADALPELAEALGIDAERLSRTAREFNESIVDAEFDPAVKDGRAAHVEPPKSNWALALDTPPYYGFAVGCGITFTFGGLHVDADARVLDVSGSPIAGLFACGEMVGGLFSGNYPGGSGLTSGAVFGRLAGAGAATV